MPSRRPQSPPQEQNLGGPILHQVSQGALHDRVYLELRRALMAGAFAPGTRFTLQSLAKAVGTSVMPVRDALRRLVAEHALDVLPNRMVAIPVLTAERLGEIRDIRLALESMAAALAVVNISDGEVRELTSIYELMKAQHDSPGADFLALNQGFHFTIYRSASRPILLAMIETLWLQTGPWLSDAVHARGGRLELQHHQSAIVALTERNSKAASRAVAAAILAASDLIAGRATDPAKS